MKKLLLILTLIFVCACVFAEYVVQEPKERCDAEDFSIMPWGNWISEGKTGDYEKFYQELYECGFNVTGFNPIEQIDNAKRHHLKISLNADDMIDYSIQDETQRYINWAEKVKKAIGDKDYKDIYQIYVQDEPTFDAVDRLRAKSGAVNSVLGIRPYINFLSKHSVEGYLDTPHYDYCHKFIEECKIGYISYDSYCFFNGLGFDEDQFYSDIESIKNIAKAHNMDFVNIILSVAHFNYMLPDDFSINVQGWSTLAYGAKGLSYFTFNRPDVGNYRAAAYYHNGSRAPLWYIIRDMNFDIHNIMPYYKNLKAVNQFHMGNVPKDARGMETAKVVKNLVAVYDSDPERAKRIHAPEKTNILVGEFVGSDGNEYAIIVNKNPEWSIYLSEFEFKNGKRITHVSSSNSWGPERDFKGEDRWIAPGHGILLKGQVSKDMTFEAMDDWKFIKDPENQGEKKGYAKPDFDFSKWKKINVNTAWEDTIGDYDGIGWYKTQADIKDSKNVFLFFGAVDEDAFVYVNGQLVLDHSRATLGLTGDQIWDMPFAVNIKPYLKEGKNDITVKVRDDKKAGGIWRGVSVVYTDQDRTAEAVTDYYSK